jgi:hypothetical protein
MGLFRLVESYTLLSKALQSEVRELTVNACLEIRVPDVAGHVC